MEVPWPLEQRFLICFQFHKLKILDITQLSQKKYQEEHESDPKEEGKPRNEKHHNFFPRLRLSSKYEVCKSQKLHGKS